MELAPGQTHTREADGWRSEKGYAGGRNMTMKSEDLQSWIGRQEIRQDQITSAPLVSLAAMLDRDDLPRPGDPVPPLWSWLYFQPQVKQSELGPDGHARRGGFLPPVQLPRRMWAGGQLEFLHDLHVGETVTRKSTILSIQSKDGSSGPLVFVTVGHEISDASGQLLLTELHDIVYRGMPAAGQAAAKTEKAMRHAEWSRLFKADDALLFRYSALTFNTHRIHYDRKYATEREMYPGLVVHGPLLATLLLDLLRRNLPEANVRRFKFRAIMPLFDTEPFYLKGARGDSANEIELWTETEKGFVTMRAVALIADGGGKASGTDKG
jgi:3-methylfumaryl-CoA hydratase